MPSRLLTAALVLLLGLVCVSCGETYRPVAQPILGLQPSPAPSHFVVSISTDGIGDNHRDSGAASNINVSGDSIRGNIRAGIAPVHAALAASGSKLYIANSGQDSVTASSVSSPTSAGNISLPPSPSATITQVTGSASTATYTYTGGTGLFSAGDLVYVTGSTTAGFNGVFTVTAASGNSFSVSNSTNVSETETFGAQAKVPNAVYVNSAESGKVYVAGYGTNSLYVINTTTEVVTAAVPVDSHPVSVAEIPDGKKVYVANHGSSASGGSVSVVDTVSDTVAKTICLGSFNPPPCPAGPVPVWAVARADSAQVYVLDQNGTVYAIDTTADAVVGSATSAAGANFMFYDRNFSRLYVTSPGADLVTVFDVSTATPVLVGNPLPIPAAASSLCTTSAVKPSSVTVLGDGSKAYVASYQLGAGTVCTQLSVIDAGSSTLTKTIPLSKAIDNSALSGCGTVGFRVFTSSSGGGTNSKFKVYVSQCDAGSVAVVDTYPVNGNPEDTFAGVSITAPLSTFPATSLTPPPQNPVFVVAGP